MTKRYLDVITSEVSCSMWNDSHAYYSSELKKIKLCSVSYPLGTQANWMKFLKYHQKIVPAIP